MQPLEPEPVDAAVHEVLAAPPFATHPDGSAAVLRRLFELWRDWLAGPLPALQGKHPLIFWTLTAVLVGVAVLLIVHMGVSLRDVWRAVRDPELDGVAEETAGTDPWSLAEAALARGDLRAAVELAFTAAMLRARAVHSSSPETPRQRARGVAGRLTAPGRAALWRLVDLHERACYAGARLEEGTAREALALARQVAGRW